MTLFSIYTTRVRDSLSKIYEHLRGHAASADIPKSKRRKSAASQRGPELDSLLSTLHEQTSRVESQVGQHSLRLNSRNQRPSSAAVPNLGPTGQQFK